MLAQVVEILRRERRVSYRALRRRFGLDEEYLEDLKVEIIQAKQLATDEDNTILVWAGDATLMSVSAPECPPRRSAGGSGGGPARRPGGTAGAACPMG
jgi:hypothetical protein